MKFNLSIEIPPENLPTGFDIVNALKRTIREIDGHSLTELRSRGRQKIRNYNNSSIGWYEVK